MLKKAATVAAISAAFLAGCDNDHKGYIPPEFVNTAPTVSVGAVAAVVPGQAVTLEAIIADAENNISSVAWSQVSGETVELSGADTESASFTAPGLPAASELVFSITVTDAEGEMATSEVAVSVLANAAPTVSISGAETAATQQTVTLTATGKDDYTKELTYTWEQLTPATGEEVVIAQEANEATFVTPATKFNTTLKFQVTAADAFGLNSKGQAEVKVTGDIHAQIEALSDFIVASDFENIYSGGFRVNEAATGAGLFKWQRTATTAAKNITAPIARYFNEAGYKAIAELGFEDMYLNTSAAPTNYDNFDSADLGTFLYAFEVTGEQKYLDVATSMWPAVQTKYGHNGSKPPASGMYWGYYSYHQLMGAYYANKHGLTGADTYFAEFAEWYEAELPNELEANPGNAVWTNLIHKEFGIGVRNDSYKLTDEDAIFDMQSVAYALMSETIEKEYAVDFLMDALQNKSDDDFSEPVAEAIGALNTFADE